MTGSGPVPLETLIQEHAPFLERLARALVGDRDRAGDLVQETWAVALARPDALQDLQAQGGGATRGWLATVLRRRMFSQLRRSGVRRAESLSPDLTENEGGPAYDLPEATAMRWERQRLVQEALHGLAEPYRTVLILRYQDDLSPKEIARRTGIQASTVRSQLTRGLELLRGTLDREHPGGRAEWLSALLPIAWPSAAAGVPAAAQSLTAVTGGVLMKKALALLCVAGLAALVWFKPWTVTMESIHEDATKADLIDPVVSLEAPASNETVEGAIASIAASTDERAEATSAAAETALGAEAAFVAKGAAAEPAESSAAGAFVISGRARLLDGTPIEGQRVSARSEIEEADEKASTKTNEDGTFELSMASAGPHTVTLACRGEIEGVELTSVAAPSQGLDLRIDAIVFRAHLPHDIDLGLFDGAGHSVVAYGAESLPFESMHYAGFSPTSVDEVTQELLPVGPGYFCTVGTGTGDSVQLIAALPPGTPSGRYDVDFLDESPELASLRVVLTGVALAAPSRVTVSLDWIRGDEERHFPASLFFREGRSAGRVDVLLPGDYVVGTRVFSPPPRAWFVPTALTHSITLEAGDEELIEVELVKGGGLEVAFTGAEFSEANDFKLEVQGSHESEWSKHSTYTMDETGELFNIGQIQKPNLSYTSWEPLPVGEIRVRLSGKGYRTVEESLYIKAAELTKWTPHLEKLP